MGVDSPGASGAGVARATLRAMKVLLLALVLVLNAAASPAWATDAPAEAAEVAVATRPALPRWEAGFAAGAAYVPDYPGADQSRGRGIVVPYLVYRGPVLRIDESGIRSRLVERPDWEFALSATAAFNARNGTAREGMPQLDWLGGLGPQWIYRGFAKDGGPTIHLKLRGLVSTDFERVDGRGFSFDPELRWRRPGFAGTSAALTLSAQPSWATRRLHAYFYEVTPAQATPTRPAWMARAGYLGTEFGATLSGRPSRTWSWFATARAMSLHGAANAGSPLLRDRGTVSIGAGIVWTPWRSSETAAD